MRALASHQYGPGSIPGLARHLRVQVLAPRGFSPGSPVSPLLKDQYFQIVIRLKRVRN